MLTVLEILFGPTRLFIEHPERAYFVAVGFLALLLASVFRAGGLRRGVHALLALTGVFWVAFGLNEQTLVGKGPTFEWTFCSRGRPLAAISLIALAYGIRDITAPSPLPEPLDHKTLEGAVPDPGVAR